MTPITLAVLTFCTILTLAGAFAILVTDAKDPDDDVIVLPDSTDAAVVDLWKQSKEEARCCKEHALPDGRPVIGFCGPDCERRPR